MKLSKNIIGWIIIAVIAVLIVVAGRMSLLAQHRNLFAIVTLIISGIVVAFFGNWKKVDEKELEE